MSDSSVEVKFGEVPAESNSEPVSKPEQTEVSHDESGSVSVVNEPVHAFTQAVIDNQGSSVPVASDDSPKAPEPGPWKTNVQSAREHLLNALEALDNEVEV